jgi:ribonuclease BN (tRNA processing enzyme)
VKVTLIPSAAGVGGAAPHQYLTTYLLNDTVALDAGALGLLHPLDAQKRVRHVVLTHAHIDHVATLPIFLENVYEATGDCVTVHATEPVRDALQRDLFNDRLWPDFIALSRREAPFLKLSLLEPGRTVELDGLRLTPVPVNHAVATVGMIVEDGAGAVVFPSDTGPTDLIWDLANLNGRVRAVFLEATFPEALRGLAEVSRHLTPSLFAQEAAKVWQAVKWYAVHIKPRFYDEVVAELRALRLPGLEVMVPGREYRA